MAAQARVGLAAEARRACRGGLYDEALASLKQLRSAASEADDVAWVEANARAVREAAAAAGDRARSQPRPQMFPRLAGVRWRVDVSISTSSLDRVMRPTVTMEWTLDDGRVEAFEMSVDQFQKMRYDTAKALRAMQETERHPIMRIDD
mmetsp:Transcript_21881/g.65598  ORF Transcript_21881/g.65598 Transcript_21881/m.65598 type:complete len:148 (+) Transcript_21881:149-592(+)